MNDWNQDQETVLEKIRQNALIMKKSNTKAYIYAKSRLANYKIPIIILSAVNSVFSVGAEKYLPQHIISGTSCLISLTVGIIGSIQLYLQIEQSLETTRESSREYYNLAIDIYKTLALDREHRPKTGDEYLTEIYSQYVAIHDRSLVMSKNYDDSLFQIPKATQPRFSITTTNMETASNISDDSI
jgi:hypothetical protein